VSYSDVAVLVPCHDEAATVGLVVTAFRQVLPGAHVVVCDNASGDGTADAARAAGARVTTEPRRGKGFAVRRLFSDVEAPLHLLVDGDGTYEAAAAPRMVDLMRRDGVDTVLAARRSVGSGAAEYRPGHRFGNAVFSRAFSRLVATEYSDVLTGYRGFTRRFVKGCPLLARGFEVKIELNAHGASLSLSHAEVVTTY
jgi:glycosyltransferase involved in cell wall biosynthesis